MGGHQHKPEDDHDRPPEAKQREAVAIQEAAADTGAAKHVADLDAGPSLGMGRGLPGAGGGHHPGDDDGCGENSLRD